MDQLVVATVFFVGIHIFVAGTPLRVVLVARLGEKPYLGVFSALSLAALVWMIWAYGRAPYQELWGQVFASRWLALALVFVAFLFMVLGLATPNPTAVGGESLLVRGDPARGIFRITRHPFLIGVLIWAAVHIGYNGDVGSLVFFGAFLLLALIGPGSIDRRQHRTLGDTWERFAAKTSIVPFLAIAQGRNSLQLLELGWWRLVVAVASYALFLWLHVDWFGVSPLGASG